MEDTIRPDILAGISSGSVESLGFICHSCGWTSASIPFKSVLDTGETMCPDCEEVDVENRLSTVIDEIVAGYYGLTESDDGRLVGYTQLADRVSAEQDAFEAALNWLLRHDDAYAFFRGGDVELCVVRDPVES